MQYFPDLLSDLFGKYLDPGYAYFDRVKELSEKFSGSVQKYVKDIQSYHIEHGTRIPENIKGEFQESIIIPASFPKIPTGGGGYKASYNLGVGTEGVVGEICMEEESDIYSIEIDIGGERIDRIFNERGLFDVLRTCYNMDGIPFHILKVGIPFSKYHELKFHVEFKDGCVHDSVPKIFYNKYKLREEFITDGLPRLYSLFFRVQFLGRDHVSKDRLADLKLGFVEPVYYLITRFVPEYDAILNNYGEAEPRGIILEDEYLQLKVYDKINGFTVYKFTKSLDFNDPQNTPIDFTEVNRLAIRFKNIKASYAYIYAISSRSIGYMEGVAGLNLQTYF